MTACLIIAAAAVQLAGAEFELSWEHSVEKTIWRETWMINGNALELREAAVKGSGAGMDPGEGAVLQRWLVGLGPEPAARGKAGAGRIGCHGRWLAAVQ